MDGLDNIIENTLSSGLHIDGKGMVAGFCLSNWEDLLYTF